MFEGLPDLCYAKNLMTKEVIIIKKGESGYFPTDLGVKTAQEIDALNEQLGVTRGEREAMYVGSLFGWEVPGANPSMYADNGMPIK